MKKAAIFFTAIFFTTTVFAQKAHLKGFELYGNASTGMFGLNYNPTNGSQFNGPGLRAGIGVGFFPFASFGVTTGVDFSVYSAFSNVKAGTNYSKTAYDTDGLPYLHNIHVDQKISEQDIMYRVELPVMLHYRHYLSSGNAIYTAAGIKLSLPMAGYFHISNGASTATGTYTDQNVTLSNLPWLGFKSTDFKGESGMISTKSSYVGSFEIGYLRKLKKTTYATFSIFGDYGLNDLRRTFTQGNLIYPSAQITGIPCSKEVDNLRLISVGVKAAWHLNLSGEPLVKGKKRTYEQPQKSVEPPVNNQTKGGYTRTGRHH